MALELGFPSPGAFAVRGATIGALVIAINCTRTAEAIMYCIVSDSPEDNFLEKMSDEVLLCRGSTRGSVGL
ncbi:UNVERIFIED_CONTAM: hypothetical protein Slati_1169600 [Sesamum latifolium]|uniref:Uncharacterized protein n=1 Tax=Sesamum latifolium TaxID=2727402 RepID=A0AAW2XCS2_9LAMI